MLQLTEWSDDLIGKKVKCISRNSGNGLIIGNVYYIKSRQLPDQMNKPRVNLSLTKTGKITGGWAYLDEFELEIITKQNLIDQITELTERIAGIQNKLDWMTSNNLEEMDTEVYKTYRIMKVMDVADFNKAKEIVSIMNESM